MSRLTIPLLALVLMAGRSSAWAQAGAPVDAAQQQFARTFVAAVRSNDAAQVRKLVHPKVLACVNDGNREYFDYLVSHELEDVPRGDYQLSITALASGALLLGYPAEMFAYPVPATHQMSIDWQRTAYASVGVVRAIAAQGGAWFIVYPCPNEAGMKFFREHVAAGRGQQDRAKALAAALKDPLRSELRGLLARGRKIDAVKRYRTETGADLTTAVQVMNVLELESN